MDLRLSVRPFALAANDTNISIFEYNVEVHPLLLSRDVDLDEAA